MAQKPQTNYAELQTLEIQALQAIYMDDFEEETTGQAAWNTKADRKFHIRLRPQSGNTDAAIFADLSVALPTTYPKSLPHLKLAFGDAVPSKAQARIQIEVKEKARQLLGDESIHEIAITIQDLLDDAAISVAQSEQLPALAEERVRYEMEALQAAAAERDAHIRTQEIERQQEEFARSALIARELALQERTKQQRIDSATTTVNEPSSDDKSSSVVNFDQEIHVRTSEQGSIVTFRCIHKLDLHRIGPLTMVYTARPMLISGLEEPSQRFLAMKLATLGQNWDEIALKTEIAERLELSLQSVQSIPSHRNVLSVLGYHIESSFDNKRSRIWIVKILTGFIPKGSLHDIIEVSGRVEASVFRTLMIQVLEGLQHLHSNDIPHGRLSLTNILVERQSDNHFTVKLSDYLYQADLYYLNTKSDVNGGNGTTNHWEPPETSGIVGRRPQVAADIWSLGIVACQLLFGVDIQSRFISPVSMLQHYRLAPSLKQMLQKMFHERPAKRSSCFDLLASAFLRSNESVLEEVASLIPSRVPSNTSSNAYRLPRLRSGSANFTGSGVSRYTEDFSEHTRLGKGGFGKVIRARNKLDGQWYAVKKIVSESSHELQSVLSEVMLLSRLSHPHIVRYVTAWLEEGRDKASDSAIQSDSETDSESHFNNRDDDLTTKGDSTRSFQNPSSSGAGFDYIGSGAHVEFGADSDDESDSSHDNASEKGNSAIEFEFEEADSLLPSANNSPKEIRKRRPSSISEIRTTLYIQMEYCENQTLRDLIREGLASKPDDYWRILRQIAGALEYVHSQGIIHRDLKPENVFITQGGTNVRLGDFGLAKPQSKNQRKGMSGGNLGPLTASIGTSVYIAPEVKSSGGGTYDEKADMYSLGIVLFEMCYTLSVTAMERAQIMEDLRRAKSVVPKDFEQSDKTLEKELVASLVVHNPSDRLSATALLEQIPSDADNEALRRLIDGLSRDTNDPLHRKLVGQLFESSQGELEARSYTYDLDLSHVELDSAQSHLRNLVKGKLISIFQHHGAVEAGNEQILFPADASYPESIKVMTSEGTILQLPHDLILPRARRLAKQHNITARKTFTLNSVFRKNGANHPKIFTVADFDLISKSTIRSALEEAEVLKVIDEVISAIPVLASKAMRFVINHSVILDTILSACNIPVNRFSSTKAQLSKLGGEKTAAQVRSELRAPIIAISSTAIDDLFRFDVKEPLDEGIQRLRKQLGNTGALLSAFEHLEKLFQYAKAFGIQRKLYLDPLSCCNAEFYEGGLMFQCLFERKRKTVLCAGGRYDSLIRKYALSRKSSSCQAVGFSMSIDGIMHAMDKYQIESQRLLSRNMDIANDLLWSSRRCDVLVDGPDETVLTSSGLSILRELWANGIRAEMVHRSEQPGSLGFGEHPEHELVLIIKADGTLKLRGQIRRDDIDVRRIDLVNTLRNELRERDRVLHSKLPERPRLRHEMSDMHGRDADVSVLWSTSRSKKSNRQTIVDEALNRTAESAYQHLEWPIIAVEMKDDLFDTLRETTISDADSWRRAAQFADPASRRYVTQIYDLLVEKTNLSKDLKGAYLYNFRSKACMCYDLTGKT